MSLHTMAVKSPMTLVFSTNICSMAGSGAQHISDTMQAAAWHKYVHIQETMYELMIMTMMMVAAAMIMVVICKMLTDTF